MHRANQIQEMEPNDEQLQVWLDKNREHIRVPERRKIPMVCVEIRRQAQDIQGKIEDRGAGTDQAAQQ